MSLIELKTFRAKRRRLFWSRNGQRLDAEIQAFMSRHGTIDFAELTSAYMGHRSSYQEEAWDYLDLRDLLSEALHLTIADELHQHMCKQRWYDAAIVSKDQLVDRCLAIIVIGQSKNVAARG